MSIALTPVLAAIELMALTTLSRVARVLFSAVVISAEAYPLMNTAPSTTESALIERPVKIFSFTFAYTPVPGRMVLYSCAVSTIAESPVVPGKTSVLATLRSDTGKSMLIVEPPGA